MRNGFGYGGGGGKGCGMGQGIGRGRGGGEGGVGRRGQGMGQGRGGGRGMGRCQGVATVAGSAPNAAEPHDAVQQAPALKAQAQDMMNQLSATTHRIAEIEATGTDSSIPIERSSKTASDGEKRFQKTTAVLDHQMCSCCGLCTDFCPEHAISMNDTVMIDSNKCTGCGSCVNECPNEAISLSDVAQRAAC